MIVKIINKVVNTAIMIEVVFILYISLCFAVKIFHTWARYIRRFL